jgi:hypothetical protein
VAPEPSLHATVGVVVGLGASIAAPGHLPQTRVVHNMEVGACMKERTYLSYFSEALSMTYISTFRSHISNAKR